MTEQLTKAKGRVQSAILVQRFRSPTDYPRIWCFWLAAPSGLCLPASHITPSWPVAQPPFRSFASALFIATRSSTFVSHSFILPFSPSTVGWLDAV